MDGNGRWAYQKGKPRLEGYQAGIRCAINTVLDLRGRGVAYATLYTFSTENWQRPEADIQGLLQLVDAELEDMVSEMHRHHIKLKHIGHRDQFPHHLQAKIDWALDLTSDNKDMTVCVALDYGGRQEIVDTIRQLAHHEIPPESLDEATFESYLNTAGLPDVDLVIRTGGEIRLSNFLLWQSAYAEFYFTKVLWPDFNSEELDKALKAFSQRRRRFGGL